MSINCPYCGKEQYINHDDGYGYEEDEIYSQQCCGCEKMFVYTTQISFDYNVEKADCLNEDGLHEYYLTSTQPRCFSKMECKVCGDIRDLTDQERKNFGIETIEEFKKQLEKNIPF